VSEWRHLNIRQIGGFTSRESLLKFKSLLNGKKLTATFYAVERINKHRYKIYFIQHRYLNYF